MQTGAASARELKNMVDASLLVRFLHLGDDEQRRLALMIGSTPRKGMAALASLSRGLP